MMAMTFPLLWFLFPVMVCNSKEKLLYLDDAGNDLPLLWFLFPVMGCNSKEKLLYLDDAGDDLPPLVIPTIPNHGLQLRHKDRGTIVP